MKTSALSKPYTLPASAVDTKYLVEYVVQALAHHGATSEDIFTTYTSNPMPWVVPSAYGMVGDTPRGFQIPKGKLSAADAVSIERSLRPKVGRWGFNRAVRTELESLIGQVANSDLLFSDSPPGPGSADLFSAEFALACNSLPGELIYQGNNIHKRVMIHGSEVAIIGLHSVRNADSDVKSLMTRFSVPRGVLSMTRFDILDRCRTWAVANMQRFDYLSVERALSLIKSVKSNMLCIRMEEEIQRIDSYKSSESRGFVDIMFTEDLLYQIRSTWVDSTGLPEIALRELYDLICPSYIDDAKFSRMFGRGLLSKEKLSDLEIDKIHQGLDSFTEWFYRVRKSGQVKVRRSKWTEVK